MLFGGLFFLSISAIRLEVSESEKKRRNMKWVEFSFVQFFGTLTHVHPLLASFFRSIHFYTGPQSRKENSTNDPSLSLADSSAGWRGLKSDNKKNEHYFYKFVC